MMKLMTKPIRFFLLPLLFFMLFMTTNTAIAQIKIGDDLSDIDYRYPRD